ncbi:hypothetical protein [Streptomyces guryensis]|uniref:Luciferase-like monooxygenase n=1 Tax=Streptomyces guryensis TaxID=2886947 RepID=A0A9Q3Z7Q4_9ACTN|nr:hypothetical protein [Streptomyces guryensis]MCD9878456.1 hypothetical protein [Streptomyces guryensis]
MKLGYHLGYWQSGPPEGALEAARLAEELGLDSLRTALGTEREGPSHLFGTADFAARVAAFREKRRPDFSGR